MDYEKLVYLGIDLGSVSLDIAALDKNGNRIYADYQRTKGKPIVTLIDALKKLAAETSLSGVANAVVTGSGRDVVGDVLDIRAENEILAHAFGSFQFNPQVRTTIEIGGQDSKLILFAPANQSDEPVITDHAMNEICAAGTGSFLDQQAGRLNIPIEAFGDLALSSNRPATVAGRCAVFAKSDLIHLQQQGTPLPDIAAGLCYAMVRNYTSNLCRGRELHKPIVFQGGVAANKGVVKAFCDLLELGPDDILIPPHYDVIGAVGAALLARRADGRFLALNEMIASLENYLEHYHYETSSLQTLVDNKKLETLRFSPVKGSEQIPVYLGVDVGAASTDIVIMSEDKDILGGVYLMTEGKPIETVKRGLQQLGAQLGDAVRVKSAGITGSGRYMVGDFIGADVVKNEIAAQAKGVRACYPEVDTIFEIGGQDSKYIRIKDGVIVDFEMNKVCAAGTGSFLAEQAEKLDIKMNDQFSTQAFAAKFPANLGSRCTVFMESDIVHHQQQGCAKEDILAGLSYSIAKNYLEKVVFNRSIGERICFSGGVAANKSVVAAFENLLEKEITVLPFHKYTGAMGAAIFALEQDSGQESNFQGFDLGERKVRVSSFECKDCPNLCEVNVITVENLTPSYYGSTCGKYDTKKEKSRPKDMPDLFKEREAALSEYLLQYNPEQGTPEQGPVIGIPRTLLYYALLPQWAAFFNTLGFRVVLSDKTNKKLLHKGMQKILTETCYPIKAAFGHVVNLIEKGVDTIFLPSYVDMQKSAKKEKSYNCPYVSAIPVFIQSAMNVTLLAPALDYENIDGSFEEQLAACGLQLGKTKAEVNRAVKAAQTALGEFQAWCVDRGREVLDQLDDHERAIVLVGKPYNTCDAKLNMNIPKHLLDMGIPTIPMDFLPLESIQLTEEWDRLIWQTGRNILRAAEIIKGDKRLIPLFITNFSCGPDAHTTEYFKSLLGDKPSLTIEIDEHFGDAGLVTRLEAFVDSLLEYKPAKSSTENEREFYPFKPPAKEMRRSEKMIYIPYMSDHTYAFELAFKSIGLKAKVLPPPDEESLELGRKYTSGVDCYPLVLMTGDLIKMQQDAQFEPHKAAYFFPGNDDPCRLSQFAYAFRRTAKRAGLEQVQIVSPITSLEKEQTSEVFGLKVSTTWWRASIAIDMLIKRKMEIRPYELNRGETDRVYQTALEEIKAAFLHGNHLKAVAKAARDMAAIPTRSQKDRPIIGIMGADYYLRINSFSNNDIFQSLEELGCAVCLPASYTDYMYLQAVKRPGITRHTEGLHMYLFNSIRGKVQFWEAARIEKAFKPGLVYHSDPPIEELTAYSQAYTNEKLEPCLVLNTGKAVDYARKGFSGIANLIPFCCLVGAITTSALKRIRADYNDIPVMTLIFDGLKQTNQKTRLEAFVHQAKLHHQMSRG